MKHHLKHMLIAGGAILAVLLVLRVDLSAALPYAIALACPLGMIFMMKGMNGHGGHDHGASGHQHGTSEVPTQDATTGAHDHHGHDHGATGTSAPLATQVREPLTRENHERIV